MTETRHGVIKLEFPDASTSREEMEASIERMMKGFQPALDSYGIRILTRHPTQIVEEQDCDCYFEINLEVTSNSFSHTIIEAMRDYFQTLLDVICYELPNIVLHSPDFWMTPLSCHVHGVPLSAIYFGNIQGGTFLNHWEISFWKETLDTLNKNSSGIREKKQVKPTDKITAEFEFDKTDMIHVHFQCLEPKNKREKNVTVLVNYQVMVRRDTIRRIIVDPNVSDNYGECRTRVHFELNCPPMIRRGQIDKEKQSNPFHVPFYHRKRAFQCHWGPNNGFPQDAAISDSPFFTIEFRRDVSTEEIYRILSRLKTRTGVSIEFGYHPSVNVPLGQQYQYNRWTIPNKKKPTDPDAIVFQDFLKVLFPPKYEIIDDKLTDVNDERKFAITYLIECLLSRGAVVKDQLLLSEIHWTRFLEIVIFYYKKDDKLCESALEDLIHLIDGRKRIGSILKCFDKICQKRRRMELINGLSDNELKEGYQRVRKVVFTPTRIIYVAPEAIMGNRVLRKFDKDGTRVLRITFRDDNNKKMRSSVTEELLEQTANKYLQNGVRVANRDYGFLGCSNSQMRDNGAYFIVKYTDDQRNGWLARHKNEALPLNFQPIISEVRRHLGKFELIENVPKMMARLGQCFTQSRLTGVELERSDYRKTYDLTGGKNLNGEEYTFSDGVGLMSYGFAQNVSEAMNFGKCVPSCFQIRFRGMKGVIAIEPYLDEVRKWSIIYDIPESVPNVQLKCAFRPSQIKFDAKSIPGDQIEMVKFSSPVLVALNKPFINILDQVSEMQSLECHRRVTNRIEELMDRQILSFAKQMNDETFCRNKLKEFPRRIDIDYLRTMWGFTLSSEPFFRSLIKASIKFSITKQLRKEQIQIPKELGRSMLGVVDETGRLQYGQIFVQYTKNAQKKFPPRSNDKSVQGSEVVTGTVLLTKNPCIVTGDVRIFEAVDIPELHHMCDVVVFPQHGPRPHPDEMAGSDLDGDEYSVIWDQELLLKYNEAPFDFSVEKKKAPYNRNELDNLMRDFYVKYLKLDSVGTISNSHLHNSDQYGLNARVCMDLAKKNCQAVDFTKSGTPPEPLTKKWWKEPNGVRQASNESNATGGSQGSQETQINGSEGSSEGFEVTPATVSFDGPQEAQRSEGSEKSERTNSSDVTQESQGSLGPQGFQGDDESNDDGEMIPPEVPERIPDYHMGNERSPMYVSPRLCGRLFREFQAIDNVIKISEEKDEQFEISIDENITIQGYENYMTSARKDLANYNGQLRSIMENYGILSEGEIMSGCIVEMRNRISDKDQDDMSFYNTNQMIETKMTSLICNFREKFFNEFGSYRTACTQMPSAYDNSNCLNFRCDMPSKAIMQKGVAWYRACYEFAQTTREVRKLSFAWIVYDVIAKVKEHHVLNGDSVEMGGANPMYTFLEQHRKQYLIDHRQEFEEFSKMDIPDELVEARSEKEAYSILKMYLKKIRGLDTVLYMLMKWAESSKLLDEGKPIRIYHFFLTFILFATRQLASADGNAEPFFRKIEKEEFEKESEEETKNYVELTEVQRSHMIVKFLEYMASRRFRKLPNLSFRPLDISSIFMRGEWNSFHVAAIKTYYNILFNLRFEELPISTDPTITIRSIVRENEPFVIELPESIDFERVLAKMAEHSGVDDVFMRRMERANGDKEKEKDEPRARVRYIVSTRGSLESIQQLKQLVAVTIPIRSHLGGQDVSKQMAFLCLQKIMDGSN